MFNTVYQTLLVSLKLANSHESGQEVPRLGVSTSPEEWYRQAQQYFSKSLFPEAEFCFRKAGMPWWSDVARAYGARQAASKLPENHTERSNAFAKVAASFANLTEQALETEYEENLRLLSLNSAEAYAMILDHAMAAELFLKAQKYTESAYYYRMAGLFEEAVGVVKRYAVDPSVAERIIFAAKITYTKRGDMASLHKAWHLCEGKAQFLEFLQDNGFEDQRVPFLESISEYEEAAQLLWKGGDHAGAILRFQKAATPSSRHGAARCLLEGMAENALFATGYGTQSDQLARLFGLAKTILLSEADKAEVDMFQAVSSLKGSELKRHGERCLGGGDIRGAILALDAWTKSKDLLGLAQADDQKAVDLLLMCRKLAKAIKSTAQTYDIIDTPPMQRMFGVSSASNLHMSGNSGGPIQRRVLPQSFIYSEARESIRRAGKPTTKEADPVILSKNTINSILRKALLERLNRLLGEIDLLARRSKAFEVCMHFLTAGRCGDGRSCWRDHVSWNAFTVVKFNLKFRLHALLIALLDEFVAIDQGQKGNMHAIHQKYGFSHGL
ncbi:hypothetical protein FRC01_000340 [Tulasnella sp. 417]|nr:hypothetical protein FRC01_000340 [Tulasnella sp. 417]